MLRINLTYIFPVMQYISKFDVVLVSIISYLTLTGSELSRKTMIESLLGQLDSNCHLILVHHNTIQSVDLLASYSQTKKGIYIYHLPLIDPTNWLFRPRYKSPSNFSGIFAKSQKAQFPCFIGIILMLKSDLKTNWSQVYSFDRASNSNTSPTYLRKVSQYRAHSRTIYFTYLAPYSCPVQFSSHSWWIFSRESYIYVRIEFSTLRWATRTVVQGIFLPYFTARHYAHTA